MTRGKIVLVPFPFDDLSASKVRPAVCLTEPTGPHHHVILAFITSKEPDELLESDVLLSDQNPAFSETGLRISSTLRLHRLLTVSISLIQRELGQLPDSAQKEVEGKLCTLLGVPGTVFALFDERYPNIAWWSQACGWIEQGRDEYSRSLIRVLDIGGMLWEGKEEYDAVGTALDEAEGFIAQWRKENGD